MRAAELISPLKFRLTDMPIEDPGPGEVQVRVESVGICGSDLHSYSEGAVGGTPNVYPMVLGHEPAGRVVRTVLVNSLWATAEHLSPLFTAITANSV
jgi:L-iditol 2-dehydrogenase